MTARIMRLPNGDALPLSPARAPRAGDLAQAGVTSPAAPVCAFSDHRFHNQEVAAQ